jgi:glycosyltransferase involved in cell wall biosynthesis
MGPTDPTIKLSILLPVRNEGINLRIMLKILAAAVEVPHEVLVVYDQPGDDSIPVVSKLQAECPHVRLIHNTLGLGVINAIRAGVGAAQGDYILIFAADEVGPVLAIGEMLALLDQGCEFVSCTRYAYGGRRLGGSLIGGLLSHLANDLFHFMAGSVLTDSTTGIKMFRRSIFNQLPLEAKAIGWAVTFEMAIKAQLAGLKLGEVPIVSIDRLYGGKSTFRLGPWFIEYLRWFVWGAVQLRRMSKAERSIAPMRAPSMNVG